jgi:PAS domain S-box-containing protein
MTAIQPLQLLLQVFLARLLGERVCVYAELWRDERLEASRGDPVDAADPEAVEGVTLRSRPYTVRVRRVRGALLPPLDVSLVQSLADEAQEAGSGDGFGPLAPDVLERSLDFVTDAFALVGDGWEILHANAAFERFTGFSSQELLGQSLWTRCGVCVIPGIRAHLLSALTDGQSREIESWSSSTDRWLSVRMFPCTEGMSVFVQDITARREDEQTRLELQRQLSQGHRMEALGTLAAGIAHDFNNVLSAVIGHVGLLREKLATTHPARLHADEIWVAASRARDLTGRILAYSRSSHGDTDKQPVKALTRESVSLLKASLPTTVRLSAELDGEDLCARIRPSEIQQVVINLCTNAWQALPDGKGHVRVNVDHLHIDEALQVDTGLIKPGRYVVLSVEDDGIGLSADVRAYLFEPFFTTKARGKGTGLGLYVVCGIVSAREGGVRVASTEGQGSRFEVFLPCCDEGEHTVTTPIGSIARPDAERGNGQRVAYVDDDPVVCVMVEQLLTNRGFVATVFENAHDALNSLVAGGFDILVTDQNMPDMSGVELAAALRARGFNGPIILSTGLVSEEVLAAAKAVGVWQVLPKERSFEDLAAVLMDCLNRDDPARPNA